MESLQNNEEITFKIKKMIAQFTDVDITDIKMESELICDLGLTSFDLACLVSTCEEEYGISRDDFTRKSVKTVEDVYKVILKKYKLNPADRIERGG